VCEHLPLTTNIVDILTRTPVIHPIVHPVAHPSITTDLRRIRTLGDLYEAYRQTVVTTFDRMTESPKLRVLHVSQTAAMSAFILAEDTLQCAIESFAKTDAWVTNELQKYATFAPRNTSRAQSAIVI